MHIAFVSVWVQEVGKLPDFSAQTQWLSWIHPNLERFYWFRNC